jgi:uroporphyrinogen III methyltransferase/synthase
MTGKVYLVGAGPGDPELLTLKGRRALEQAGVVLFDHLASEELLSFAPAGAERIYVGKKRADHAVSQQEITGRMITEARAGKVVVRLKGGDPFIFGRGGEEVEALAEAGIAFEVVPGVTSPLGIAAYAGVPLTHREHTSMVTFVTGHDPAGIDWSRVRGSATIVVFMGLTHAQEIAERLIAAGQDPATPAMAVRWATRPEQRTVVAPLEKLPAAIHQAGLKPPATILIGDVVSLYGKWNWFERLPLFGQKIVVTRPKSQAAQLAGELRSLGAAVFECPLIEIRPSPDYAALDRAIGRLQEYDWLLFTSVNGVRYFCQRLDRSGADWRQLRARICAIGPATRHAIEALHLKVDLMPGRYVAEDVVNALEPFDVRGQRFLLPRAAEARDVIPRALTERGAMVDVVEAYRTVIPDGAAELARKAFSSEPHWVTVTSSSTVKNLVSVVGREQLAAVKLASIGPVTSTTVREHGLEVAVQATEFTERGLVEAISSYCGSRV